MFIIPYFFLGVQLLAKKVNALNKDLVCAGIFLFLGEIYRAIVLSFDIFDIRLEQLMIGIATGYVCRLICKNEKLRSAAEKHRFLGDSLSGIILLLIIIYSSGKLMKFLDPVLGNYSAGNLFLFLTGIIMCFLIMFLCLYSSGVVSRLLSIKPMVFLGKISYTVYLIHIFVSLQIKVESDFLWFLCTFSVSIVLAYLIETALSFVIDKCKALKAKHVKA